jgi:hypothetical protein
LTDRRPAPASRAASSVRSRAATRQTGSLIRVYIRFDSTCFQHARDTRYRFHFGCNLSRRNHELDWSSSNVWRGGRNFHLAHVTGHRSCSHFEPPPTLSQILFHLNLSSQTRYCRSLTARCSETILSSPHDNFHMPSSKPQPSRPIVLEPCKAHHVLQLCLRHPSQSKHLIVCSTRDAFLQSLLYEITQESQNEQDTALDLLTPTLSNLHNSRNVQITFCSDLTNLRAYITTLEHPHLPGRVETESRDAHDQPCPLLVVINPIGIHEHTLSYSAQGFNRTFASIVDVAHGLGHQLIMVECIDPEDEYETGVQEDEDMLDGNRLGTNAWDQDLSMLNITTKTFGAGERAWVGRTVKIRQVAGRWCEFQKLEEYSRTVVSNV